MSNKFEFEIKGNQDSFIEMLEKNNIPYTRILTTKRREESDDRMGFMTWDSLRHILTPENIRLIISLTPFALAQIWKWYKGRKKASRLSVKIEGDLLELDTKTLKTLGELISAFSKQKTRHKERRTKPKIER